jgi:hypothetical protein
MGLTPVEKLKIPSSWQHCHLKHFRLCWVGKNFGDSFILPGQSSAGIAINIGVL